MDHLNNNTREAFPTSIFKKVNTCTVTPTMISIEKEYLFQQTKGYLQIIIYYWLERSLLALLMDTQTIQIVAPLSMLDSLSDT